MATLTVDNLVTIATVDLLVQGGVDNWDWYGESLENAGYTADTDPVVDAENFLSALQNGGVDNWDWYGESLTGLDEYEEYLEDLQDLSAALNIHLWKVAQDVAEKAAQANVAPVEPVAEPVNTLLTPRNESEKVLHAHLVANYPQVDADELFNTLIEGGFWKRNHFPVEFEKGIKEVKQGVENPMEKARAKMLALITKNGKLDAHIKATLAA